MVYIFTKFSALLKFLNSKVEGHKAYTATLLSLFCSLLHV